MSDNTQYIRRYVPNKEMLARLLTAARGSHRTMAEFAKLCGVSPTTFSRITGKNIKKPLTEELIRSIAEHSADPAASYDSLMRANGMVSGSDDSDGSTVTEKLEEHRLSREIQSILARELFDRGYMIAILQNLHAAALSMQKEKSRFGLSYPSSFGIRTQGYEPLFWNIIVDPTVLTQEDIDRSRELGSSAHLRASMRKYAPLFLMDAWESDALAQFKNTLVFIDRLTYETFKERLMTVRVNSEMSLLLVDTEQHRIIEEAHLPRADGNICPSLLEKEKLGDDRAFI